MRHLNVKGIKVVKVKSILLVCVGNICRSCAAEKIMKSKLTQDREKDHEIKIQSAGIDAVIGHPVHSNMEKILADNKIESKHHQARQLTHEMLNTSDLILFMELSHKKDIIERMPTISGKCFLLSHWLDSKDIPDPYGRSEEFFYQVFEKIVSGVNSWVDRLAS